MNPRIKEVYPLKKYQLHLIFSNGEEKIFDTTPFLDLGVFNSLKDPVVFNTVRPFLGSIIWANDVDICPDMLYLDSKKCN